MNKSTYIHPTVKVVTFRTERGFASSSVFQRDGDRFFLDLVEGEARGEQFSVDSWDQPDAPENTQFHNNDWGTL